MGDRERIVDLEVAVAKLISEVGQLWKHLGRVSTPYITGPGHVPVDDSCPECGRSTASTHCTGE